MSFAFPSGLFVAGDTIFAQCADGIRQTTVAGGPVSLALPAGDMVFEDDPGSPSPYPKARCPKEFFRSLIEVLCANIG